MQWSGYELDHRLLGIEPVFFDRCLKKGLNGIRDHPLKDNVGKDLFSNL
jgi:hypothetical protein